MRHFGVWLLPVPPAAWVSSLNSRHISNCTSNTFPSLCPGWFPTWDKRPHLLVKEHDHTSCRGQLKHCVLDEVHGHLAPCPPGQAPASMEHFITCWSNVPPLLPPRSSLRLGGLHSEFPRLRSVLSTFTLLSGYLEMKAEPHLRSLSTVLELPQESSVSLKHRPPEPSVRHPEPPPQETPECLWVSTGLKALLTCQASKASSCPLPSNFEKWPTCTSLPSLHSLNLNAQLPPYH